jgi:hypothetical protein
MRIAIYARVSTDDKGQDPENQLRQRRRIAPRTVCDPWSPAPFPAALMVADDVVVPSIGAPSAPISASSTAYCSGRSIGLPAKAWCRPSCTCN